MKTHSSIAYPAIIKLVTRGGIQAGLIIVTLFLTLYYNTAYYWYTPITGVQVGYDDHRLDLEITQVLPNSPGEAAGLQTGDRLLAVDGQAIANFSRPFYMPKSVGESVYYTVERGSQRLTFAVIASDYLQHPDYLLEMLPIELLSLVVYGLGLLLCLFSASQDVRARLVGAVWLLAGLALAAGGPGYANGGWFVFDVYLTVFAIGSYLSLAAHLYFPAVALSNRARIITLRAHFGLTLLALAIYTYERIITSNSLPPETLFSGTIIKYIFNLTWLANIGLLLKNRFAATNEQTKRQANIILVGTLLGILPFLLLSSLPSLLLGPRFVILSGQITVLILVFIPFSYGYVVRQQKLLRIDLMVNRALAWFIVFMLALLASASVVGILTWLLHGSMQVLLFGGVLATVIASSLHTRIQVWVDHLLYGTSYDFRRVTTHLSRRLAQITDQCDLDGVLVEFIQQMHIQKSRLLLARDGCLELRPEGEPQCGTISTADDEICRFLLNSSFPERALSVWAVAGPESERWVDFEWGHIFAPIVYHGALHGVWVLGDRLTGNYYSDQDIENITTMSQLIALTAANIAASDSLHGLAQRLVQTDEEQRRSVARDLHDDVLQDVMLLIQHNQSTLPQSDLAARYDKLAEKLSQIIKAQRPSFLEQQDIVMALEDLVDDMQQRAGDKPLLSLSSLLPEPPITLNGERTTALYRIVQEALSNVLKHAQATAALVSLEMDQGVLEIEIRDDGIGMENPAHVPPGHYGLMGMRERATMIGATLTITSDPDEGTIVLVRLKL